MLLKGLLDSGIGCICEYPCSVSSFEFNQSMRPLLELELSLEFITFRDVK